MKVLYDHQMFSIQRYGGVSKYFCELMKNLPKDCGYDLSLLISENNHLKESNSFLKKVTVTLPEKPTRIKNILREKIYHINDWYSKYSISKNKFDLFHPTYYYTYFLPNLKKPFVLTVHDLIPFLFKKNTKTEESLRIQFETGVKNAKRIIAISQNTKKDLVNILNINPEKIDVVYHGYNVMRSAIQKENTFGRYILYVGRRGEYKNFTKFLIAASKLLKEDKELKLICIGEPFYIEELNLINHLEIDNQVKTVSVDEVTLNRLYSNALVFVYPSLYEGFGMPILEAFANNCPVALSDRSCFPEIAGNAAIYFNPEAIDSISESIKKVIYDPDLSKVLVEKGQERLTCFSWEKCASQTTDVYKSVIG